jgi:hypothetical protein
LRIHPPNIATITRIVTKAINNVPPRTTLLLWRCFLPLLESRSGPDESRRDLRNLPPAMRSIRPRSGGSPTTLSEVRTGVESRM